MHRPGPLPPVVLAALATAFLGTAAGCDLGSIGGGSATPAGRWHPEGFAAPAMHGPETMQQKQDCRGCHGEALEGFGAAPSCDGCHAPLSEPTAWRKDCTFCHGGDENDTGAPPRNIDGADSGGAFPLHDKHVRMTMGAKADCNQCHTKAIDVLSPDHVFDDSKGVPENDFGAGISPQAHFDPGQGCTTTYCHGSGRADDGAVSMSSSAMTCVSCHAGMASDSAARAVMSGAHALHLNLAGVTCGDCHKDVTGNGVTLADASRHVNGVRDVAFTQAGVSFDAANQTCTGTCHAHGHNNRGWGGGGGGAYHPAGWADPSMHGPEFSLQRQDCRSCHGQDLTGGSSGVGCDSCHSPAPQQPTAWRTNCTFCHGGTKNQTGAPPRDPGAAKGTTAARFVSHTVHVTGSSMAVAYDCTQCHKKPTDVLSPGHAFDATGEGIGEVTMAAGRSPAGTFAADKCSNLYCHGNGRGDNGTVTDGQGAMTCASCHAGMLSGSTAWSLMSGDHRKHLSEGMTCAECHADVTDNGTTIKNAALHVDKVKQVKFQVAGFTWNPATRLCTGSCHGEGHNETW